MIDLNVVTCEDIYTCYMVFQDYDFKRLKKVVVVAVFAFFFVSYTFR